MTTKTRYEVIETAHYTTGSVTHVLATDCSLKVAQRVARVHGGTVWMIGVNAR